MMTKVRPAARRKSTEASAITTDAVSRLANPGSAIFTPVVSRTSNKRGVKGRMRSARLTWTPSVAAKLNLTDDQKAKTREIVEATRGSFAGAFNKDASEQERTDARNKRAATQKQNMAKVQGLLTDDQKKAWKELTGEPIEIQYPARRSNS